jgi:hypothetical protein
MACSLAEDLLHPVNIFIERVGRHESLYGSGKPPSMYPPGPFTTEYHLTERKSECNVLLPCTMAGIDILIVHEGTVARFNHQVEKCTKVALVKGLNLGEDPAVVLLEMI